jgi:HK97 family phage prohead protease
MKPTLTIPLEIKSLSDREFEGHGSVFKNVDLGGDIVVPGAFKRSLKENPQPLMLWMHDPERVPGKWLDVHEDSKGLAVHGVLADTDLGNEIHTLLKMGALGGLSIGYRTIDQDFDKQGNRLLKELELPEVSIVSMPMNPLARVAHVKSRLSAACEYVPTIKEFESILRNAGCSNSVAKRISYMLRNIEDDDSERLESAPRKAVDDEVSLALKRIQDQILAEAIRRKVA